MNRTQTSNLECGCIVESTFTDKPPYFTYASKLLCPEHKSEFFGGIDVGLSLRKTDDG